MSNYAVTGHLKEAGNSLYMAASAMPRTSIDWRVDKLHARITRLMHSVESAEKLAKKLIPGGFVAVSNSREDDKRAQRHGDR